jgi:hypothetical protein
MRKKWPLLRGFKRAIGWIFLLQALLEQSLETFHTAASSAGTARFVSKRKLAIGFIAPGRDFAYHPSLYLLHPVVITHRRAPSSLHGRSAQSCVVLSNL